MNNLNITLCFTTASIFLISGCATSPLSERTFGQKIPLASNATGESVAQLIFSSDKKYESEKGVPLDGDPLICIRQNILKINSEAEKRNQLNVKAGEEISVTSVVQWTNTGWQKTCSKFVTFTPESGAKYIIVNERIGGKGLSAMWTGVGLQSCQVSVYKESANTREKTETRLTPAGECQIGEK
jgi:hypothetical protein